MANNTKNTVSASRIDALVAFVGKYNKNEGRGCPVGAIEYVGGFTKPEIKAAKASGKLESGKGNEGGFYVAGNKPAAKGPVVKATVKNQMAAFLRNLKQGHTVTAQDMERVSTILADYDAQNEKRRKSED